MSGEKRDSHHGLLAPARQFLRSAMHIDLPVEGHMPPLDGATRWLNSPPLSTAGLRGKVVAVDFCTYSCINWLRSLPAVRAWAEACGAHGLVTIGVHTPEFDFEHDAEHVRRALADMRVDYPVAMDNDYAIWQAFDNHYWPALYLVDAEGRIRHHHFGEGGYEESEMVIRQLLADAGAADLELQREPVPVDARDAEVAADWDSLGSPESYLGYYRAESFASPGGVVEGRSQIYEAPARLDLNRWALTGDWTIRGQPIELNEAGGRIACRFHARDLHLVMGPGDGGAPVMFRVLVDGQPPGPDHGVDVDEQGSGTATEPRLYQLVRQRGRVGEHTFEITFLDPGVQAYVFTFG
jgi:hypothetical protein